MIKLKTRETVILAQNFNVLIAWYKNTLGFKITKLFKDDYHYCNLESNSGLRIGIADAGEMGINPNNSENNTVIMQFEVDDLQTFFKYLKENTATITGGPSYDEKGKFWFGSFLDIEGNPFWVVDKNCP